MSHGSKIRIGLLTCIATERSLSIKAIDDLSPAICDYSILMASMPLKVWRHTPRLLRTYRDLMRRLTAAHGPQSGTWRMLGILKRQPATTSASLSRICHRNPKGRRCLSKPPETRRRNNSEMRHANSLLDIDPFRSALLYIDLQLAL